MRSDLRPLPHPEISADIAEQSLLALLDEAQREAERAVVGLPLRLDGSEGEALACRHLKARGFEILARNFRCRSGEVDIVMSNVTITPERNLRAAFVGPYFVSGKSLLTRAGHITSAVNIPVLSFLDESGRFKPLDELAAMHEGDRNARFITYCGGGIAASSTSPPPPNSMPPRKTASCSRGTAGSVSIGSTASPS